MSSNPLRSRFRRILFPVLIVFAILCLALLVWWSSTGANPFHLGQSPTLEVISSTPTLEIDSIATPTKVSLTQTDTSISAESIPPGAPIVLIGTVIDGTGADPVSGAAVVIQGEKITAIGPREDVEIPADGYVFEMAGATILPGFINAHVHNGYNAVLLKQWAREGVTMVRDLGARHPNYRFSLRDENNQDPEKATAITAGPLVTVPGGYPIAGNGFPSLTVTSADDAHEKITELISDGADVIKIVIQEDAPFPTLSKESAAAIVDTAHQFGVPVSAHINSLNDLKFALEVGVDDAAHMVGFERVPGYVLEQMVEAGMIWVPTLEPFGGRDGRNLERYVKLGGIVAMGNDGGLLPGIQLGMPIREIEMMHDAGLTSMEVIVASTNNAAAVCHRDETHGTLEVGKIADILVVFGNPLEDLSVLTDVRMVIRNGVIIRDEAPPE